MTVITYSSLADIAPGFSMVERQLVSTETAINLLPKVHERVLSLEQVGHMKQLYSLLYLKHNISHFSHFYEHSTSASLLGETYNSGNSRNSVYISSWPKTSHINNMVKRICRIDYFLKHTVTLSRIETSTLVTSTHLLCHVSWFKVHTWFGNSAIVCKNEIEEESLFSFIPLQRLMAPCTFGYFTLKFDLDTSETVLVAIPLPFHRCI